ncbi:septal ring lytic transglycosylase RlpA family protein [Aureimonas sp. AU40]|uniref:septal ring lytic transglycosylase RlpA family protein n=1 Tax=unclassified Aureimonas TaxID=2615206 RepID=UPI000781D017
MNARTLVVAASTLATLSLLATPQAAMAAGKSSCGGASWYALTSRTASGERMNPSAMTAAHKTLPLGSKVKVTNLRNNRSVVVRINDRGPFIKGRLIDLSKGAAAKLGFVSAGHTQVQIEPADGSSPATCG